MIRWSEIEAECGGYRAGFVAVFRKYEGQLTDEKDAYGRPVKVTAASFAKHLGIATSTFDRWLKIDPSAGTKSRSKTDLTRDVLRAARHEPEAVIAGIMAAPDSVADEIFHELKLRRAGEDRSPAARKAAEAGAHEALGPMRRAIASTSVELCIQALDEAAEAMLEADSEDAITAKDLERIDKGIEKVVLARHEVGFKVEVSR